MDRLELFRTGKATLCVHLRANIKEFIQFMNSIGFISVPTVTIISSDSTGIALHNYYYVKDDLLVGAELPEFSMLVGIDELKKNTS